MNELYDLILEISNTDAKKCMLCGKCSGRCPNFDNLDIKPHQFVYMINKGELDKLFKSKTIHYCLSCLECVERCPRNVAPADLINTVREIYTRKKSLIDIDDSNHLIIDEDTPQQLIVSAFRKLS